jgi:hypothetical protein
MFSDRGGQLMAADEELKAMVKSFNVDKLQQYGAMNGMLWTFSSPGSPMQNGITEAIDQIGENHDANHYVTKSEITTDAPTVDILRNQ